MLPGLDGIEVLRRLRQESGVYVSMLTAKAAETDKLVGLSTGADDYLTKPFSPRELVARVESHRVVPVQWLASIITRHADGEIGKAS